MTNNNKVIFDNLNFIYYVTKFCYNENFQIILNFTILSKFLDAAKFEFLYLKLSIYYVYIIKLDNCYYRENE
jgi:hypothetical protein